MMKKMRYFLLLLSGLTAGWTPSYAECELGSPTLSRTFCSTEGRFAVKIDFDFRDVSECFTVTGNGKSYGTFPYAKLPIVIDGLEGDCLTKYEFVIRDCEKPDCKTIGLLGVVCCPQGCQLFDLVVENTPCDTNDQYFTFLNFKHLNTSSCFTLKINNQFFDTLNYKQLPVKLGPFTADCHTERVFSVRDCEKLDCDATLSTPKVCCGDPCQFSNVRIEHSPCDSNGKFYAHLIFQVKNPSDSFWIKVNDLFLGKFRYGNASSAAYRVGPLPGDCKTKFNILLKDHKITGCAFDTIWGPVCCDSTQLPCRLYDLVSEKTHCDSLGQFYMHFNFQHQSTSDCFRILGNGKVYAEFKYSQLPVKIGPLKGDCQTPYEFAIEDCHFPDCRLIKELGKVCCDSFPGLCNLSELRYETSDCNEHDQVSLFVNFNYSNTSECFNLFLNGSSYGTFRYGQLPVRIDGVVADCRTSYKLLIKDCEKPLCALDKNLGVFCCDSLSECAIRTLKVERTPCDSNRTFYIYLLPSGDNTSECFRVLGNGHDYGTFKYTNVPVKLGPFKADCLTEYEWVVQDCEHPDCRKSHYTGKVCCEGDCRLGTMSVERTECNALNQFYAFVKFTHAGASDCFRLKGNGRDYGTFQYSAIPIKVGPLNADCNTPYEFIAIDCHKADCKTAAELGRVCCDSAELKFSAFKMERSDCDHDSTFDLAIKFAYRQVSDSFLLFINGRHRGTYAYGALPVRTPRLKADCKSIYTLQIVDQKDSAAYIVRHLERPCCLIKADSCQIRDVKATPLYCTGPGKYALKLNFRHLGTTNAHFDVYDRNGPVGYFSFADLPITLMDFKKTGRLYDYVKICENDNPSCCSVVEFLSIECNGGAPTRNDLKSMVVNYRDRSVLLFSDKELPADLQIEVYNLEGRLLSKKFSRLSPYELEIDMGPISPDIYFVKVKSEEYSRILKFFNLK